MSPRSASYCAKDSSPGEGGFTMRDTMHCPSMFEQSETETYLMVRKKKKKKKKKEWWERVVEEFVARK